MRPANVRLVLLCRQAHGLVSLLLLTSLILSHKTFFINWLNHTRRDERIIGANLRCCDTVTLQHHHVLMIMLIDDLRLPWIAMPYSHFTQGCNGAWKRSPPFPGREHIRTIWLKSTWKRLTVFIDGIFFVQNTFSVGLYFLFLIYVSRSSFSCHAFSISRSFPHNTSQQYLQQWQPNQR